MKTLLFLMTLFCATYASAYEFKIGQRVLNNGWIGTITAISKNSSLIYVEFDSNRLGPFQKGWRKSNYIASIEGCAEYKFCVGDRVIQNGWRGTIRGVYTDPTKVYVEFDSEQLGPFQRRDVAISILQIN